MPTIDEETLRLYGEMQAAARDGNLLSYANNLARSMVGRGTVEEQRRELPRAESQPVPNARRASFVQREDAVETRSDPTTVRPSTPQPSGRRSNDGVKVSDL